MNPILDRKSFVADPEAHKMHDGRLYVYGSLDISGKRDYCSQQYKVFSTDDPKLEKWTDHGISFSNAKGSCDVKLILPDENEIGKININSDEYKIYNASISKTEGIQPLWLIFNGEASVVYFEFKQ